jgi:hypothetical protein
MRANAETVGVGISDVLFDLFGQQKTQTFGLGLFKVLGSLTFLSFQRNRER